MIKKLFYMAIGMMATSAAMAANQDEISWDAIQNQVQDSGSVHLLAKLYGSWVLNLFGNGGSGTDVIVTPVTVFAALIGVAGWSLFMILAGYVGVVGLIRTAQHGEFLGRDWDSTWVLARMLTALILSAPLASTGGSSNLAAGQTLVIRAAVISSAAADIVWAKTLTAIGKERIRSDKTMQVDVNFPPDQALGLVRKGYLHGMCYAAQAKYDTQLQGAVNTESAKEATSRAIARCQMDPRLFESPPADFETFTGSGIVKQRDGDMVIGGLDVWYKPESVHRGDIIRYATTAVAEQYYFRGFKVGTDTVNQDLPNDYATTKILQIAKDFQNNIKKSVEDELQAGYHNSAAMYGSDAQRYGWVSAGNFYRVLATQQTSINAALNAAVSVGGSNFNPEELTSGLSSDDIIYYNANRAITVGDKVQELYQGSVLPGIVNASAQANIGYQAGQLLTAHTGDALDSVGLNLLRAGETSDPLITASNIGHGLVTLSTAGTIATKVTAPGRLLTAATGDTLPIILTVLFIVGVFLGDILPSLPWVYFLFGTIAWLVHVTEMFVSAPLWIAAHAAPEGSNHTSNLAAKGYNNMLYVMLYPVLAIGGFVAAMSINWIGMYMLNQLIGEQFMNQLGGGLGLLTHGIGTLVGFAFLYLACAWIIVNTSFNLITAFPRTILNWLSTADPGHNAFDNGGHQVLGSGVGVLRSIGGPGRAVQAVKKLISVRPGATAGEGANKPNPDL